MDLLILFNPVWWARVGRCHYRLQEIVLIWQIFRRIFLFVLLLLLQLLRFWLKWRLSEPIESAKPLECQLATSISLGWGYWWNVSRPLIFRILEWFFRIWLVDRRHFYLNLRFLNIFILNLCFFLLFFLYFVFTIIYQIFLLLFNFFNFFLLRLQLWPTINYLWLGLYLVVKQLWLQLLEIRQTLNLNRLLLLLLSQRHLIWLLIILLILEDLRWHQRIRLFLIVNKVPHTVILVKVVLILILVKVANVLLLVLGINNLLLKIWIILLQICVYLVSYCVILLVFVRLDESWLELLDLGVLIFLAQVKPVVFLAWYFLQLL